MLKVMKMLNSEEQDEVLGTLDYMYALVTEYYDHRWREEQKTIFWRAIEIMNNGHRTYVSYFPQ